jgi:hypothetical protein
LFGAHICYLFTFVAAFMLRNQQLDDEAQPTNQREELLYFRFRVQREAEGTKDVTLVTLVIRVSKIKICRSEFWVATCCKEQKRQLFTLGTFDSRCPACISVAGSTAFEDYHTSACDILCL